MWNVSWSRVFIGQREISLWLYTTLWVGLCVWHACVFVCARRGGEHKLQWERKNKKGDGRQKSLWGSLSSAGLVSVWTPRTPECDLFHSPFFLLTAGKAHARTRRPTMSRLTYFIPWFSEIQCDTPERGIVLSGCHKHFPSLPTYRGGESVQLYPLAAGSLVS